MHRLTLPAAVYPLRPCRGDCRAKLKLLHFILVENVRKQKYVSQAVRKRRECMNEHLALFPRILVRHPHLEITVLFEYFHVSASTFNSLLLILLDGQSRMAALRFYCCNPRSLELLVLMLYNKTIT